MEEKKRYYYDGLGEDIFDSEMDDYPSNETICALLNQQDKRIKDLEEQIKTKDTINNLYKATLSLRDNDFKDLVYENNELKQENKQLKEQISKMEETQEHIMSGKYIPANVAEKSLKLSEQLQKQLAISELQALIKHCYEEEDFTEMVIDEYVKERIKILKGEKL